MKAFTIGRSRDTTRTVGVLAFVAVAVALIVKAAANPKLAFYLDGLERTKLLYAYVPLTVAGLVAVLKYPRLSLLAMVFVLPANTVGGSWGDYPHITLGRLVITVGLGAALFSTALAPAAASAWIRVTRLGHASVFWLICIVVAIAVGFVSTPNRRDWIRETNWMIFFAAVLPAGTPLRDRRDVTRLLQAGAWGVGLMQTFAFRQLATGHRYDRTDVQGGEAFFRAQFSMMSVFYLYLVLTMFFVGTSVRGTLTRAHQIGLFAAIAALSAGLLATMGRGLWISVAAGGLVLLAMVPWNRSTVRAAVLVAAGVAASVGLVVVIDSLSPESRGNWTTLAWDFFFALGEKGSVTLVSRQLEWVHALEVWARSPVVGLGFGYPFPDNPYNVSPADPFYMHNSYMNVLAKCGAMGLLGLLCFLAAGFHRQVRNHYDTRADLYDRVLAIALAASVAQMAVIALFVPLITTTDTVLGFALLIGVGAAQHRIMARRGAA